MQKCTRSLEFVKFEGVLTDEMKEWFKERNVSVELDECALYLSIEKDGDVWPSFTYLNVGEYIVYDNATSSDVDDDDAGDCTRTESFWKTYTEENFKKSFHVVESDLDARYPAGFHVCYNSEDSYTEFEETH